MIKQKRTKKSKESKDTTKKEKKFKAVLVGRHVFSNSQRAFDLYSNSRFGEPRDGKIYYALVEAAYLLEKGKITIYKGKRKLSKDTFIKIAEQFEHNFHTRYLVYKDMRSRGYIIKTALKFGADFRVYEKGIKPGEEHAKWILYPVYETDSMTWHEFSAKSRVAHSTRKQLLIGIVDEEGDITYYTCAWIRP